MGDKTKIAWTDMTWNPLRGCSPVSPGCGHCYAETIAGRFGGAGLPYEGTVDERGRWNGIIRLVPDKLLEPTHKQRPRRIFPNSMSDWGHENVPFTFWCAMLAIMGGTPWHVYQPLTKRPGVLAVNFARLDQRVVELMPDQSPIGDESVKMDPRRAVFLAGCARSYGIGVKAHFEIKERLREQPWPLPNVHAGVSAEDQRRWDERVPELLALPNALPWVSVEPQIGPIDPLPLLHRIGWIVVGGESGPKSRPFDLGWGRDWAVACSTAGVPLFMKQVGSNPIESLEDGSQPLPITFQHPKGEDITEWPEDLRVRQFPTELEAA